MDVLILIALLGHDSFRVRAAATSALALRNDVPAFCKLIQFSDSGADLETATRAKWVAKHWLSRNGDKLYPLFFKADYRFPWISSLPPECPYDWGDLLHKAGQTGIGNVGPQWANYRLATKWMIEAMMSSDPHAIAPLLLLMRHGDRAWIDCHGSTWVWPCASRRFVR